MSRRPQHLLDHKSLCVALLGKKTGSKNEVGNRILRDQKAFLSSEDCLSQASNSSFMVVNTWNFFDEDCRHLDQQIIDFMAVTYPGPDLFLLVIDPEEVQEENVVAQITKLQDIFGDSMSTHLVILLPNTESFYHLRRLEMSNLAVSVNKENLSDDCEKWCRQKTSFLFKYDCYSEEVVVRRKTSLQNISTRNHLTQEQPSSHTGVGEHTIVVLGRVGTGKSATGNTLLKAGGVKTSSFFKSEASSMPVTRKCEVKFTKLYNITVRVVDTPDFFSEDLQGVQADLDLCRYICRRDSCTFLLVFQLGRFSEDEKGILDRLEKLLGSQIRGRTIVLLTHKEDLGGQIGDYLKVNPYLQEMVQQCNYRFHLFNNTSKDFKQVKHLLKKIPECQAMISANSSRNECVLS